MKDDVDDDDGLVQCSTYSPTLSGSKATALSRIKFDTTGIFHKLPSYPQ